MKYRVLLAAVLLALSTSVYATNNGNNGNNGNNNGPTFGGSLTSTNTAIAGSSAEATVKNESTNLNVNNVGIDNAIKNIVNQAQDQIQKQGQIQGQSTENANNAKQETNVVVEGDKIEYERPVASALAPTTFATAMCQAARSGGFQNEFLGISLGGTITDENCMKLEQLRVVSTVVNDQEVVDEMACLAAPLYRQARKNTKKPCAEDSKGNVVELEAPKTVSFNKIMGQP